MKTGGGMDSKKGIGFVLGLFLGGFALGSISFGVGGTVGMIVGACSLSIAAFVAFVVLFFEGET